MNEKDLVNKGVMAEQFVAQHLAFHHQGKRIPGLTYWHPKSSDVDFVISNSKETIPIKVKAGSTGQIKSLWQLIGTNKLVHKGIKLDLKLRESLVSEHNQTIITMDGSRAITAKIFCLPLFLVENLMSYIEIE